MAKDISDWDEVGDRFFRKREVYEMDWPDNRPDGFDRYVVCGCPFGGPVAIVVDERKLLDVSDVVDGLRIFTASGRLISHLPWPHRGLVKLGWTAEEHLVCVLEDGSVYIYSIYGKEINTFRMGECERVADAIVYDDGIVCRSAGADFEIWAITSLTSPSAHAQPLAFPDMDRSRPPVCMAIIDPKKTENKELQVLLATGDGFIVYVDLFSSRRLNDIPYEIITNISVSSNGQMIALFDQRGTLAILPVDFGRPLAKFETNSTARPMDIKWCGSDAVVLAWQKPDQVALIVASADSSKYIAYRLPTRSVALIQEIDSIGVIYPRAYEVIQLVPSCTQNIFSIGASGPTAKLYDSMEGFLNGDAHADRYRREIEDMEAAVTECLDAAKNELDRLDLQKKLLQAAAYGKIFAEDFEAETFVDVCRKLRVLNAIRKPEIGMPLSFDQFEILTPEVVIHRLIHRRHHLLAIRICEYSKRKPHLHRALEHWACTKIENAPSRISDQELLDTIQNKLRDFPGFSYAKIAQSAFHTRRDLAIKLLDFEPRAQNQVQSLIQFMDYQKALEKALYSLDADLINQTLIQLLISLSNPEDQIELFRLISQPRSFSPIANRMLRSLFQNVCQEEDPDIYKKYVEFIQDAKAVGNEQVRDALRFHSAAEVGDALNLAAGLYEKDRNSGFEVKAAQDARHLNILQERLDDQLQLVRRRQSIRGLNCMDTIERLLEMDYLDAAIQVKREMHVTDDRFYIMASQIFARNGQWGRFHEFIPHSYTPACGWASFIEICEEYAHPQEAMRYIDKMSDHHEKLEWLWYLKFWDRAADVAIRANDMESLQMIRASCDDPNVIQKIDAVLR